MLKEESNKMNKDCGLKGRFWNPGYKTQQLPYVLKFIFYERYKQFLPFFLGSALLPFCVFPFMSRWDAPKWILLYLLTASNLLLTSRDAQFSIPYLTKLQKYFLVLAVSVIFFNYFYHKVSFFENASMERILFWALFFYYCASFKSLDISDKQYLYIPLFMGTGLFVICAFLGFSLNKSSLAFTFYNINKSAEFVGFSLVLQLGLFSSYQGKIKKILFFLIAVSLAYLYFTKCRSTSIGVICVIGYLFWTRNLSLKSCCCLLLTAGIFIIIVSSISSIVSSTSSNIFQGTPLEKGSSGRSQLLLSTLALIREFPLGVGLGRYEAAMPPYVKLSEYYNFIFSPHNEALRFIAEDGIIQCALIGLLFVSFVFPFQKLKKISALCPESIAFFIFFIFQFLFQFPLIQPFPLFLIPFVLAYTAHYTNELTCHRSLQLRRKSKIFEGFSSWYLLFNRFIGGVFLLSTIALTTSFYISEGFFESIDLNKYIYHAWNNKENLHNIVFMSYADKNYKEVKEYAIKGLINEPQDLFLIKYLGLTTLNEGNVEKGCSYLKIYDDAYQNRSSVHEKIIQNCL
jgi:hypothetical protein